MLPDGAKDPDCGSLLSRIHDKSKWHHLCSALQVLPMMRVVIMSVGFWFQQWEVVSRLWKRRLSWEDMTSRCRIVSSWGGGSGNKAETLMAAFGFQIFTKWETLLLPNSKVNDNEDFNDTLMRIIWRRWSQIIIWMVRIGRCLWGFWLWVRQWHCLLDHCQLPSPRHHPPRQHHDSAWQSASPLLCLFVDVDVGCTF